MISGSCKIISRYNIILRCADLLRDVTVISGQVAVALHSNSLYYEAVHIYLHVSELT